jgi:tRNA-splicing ligase RtcB
VRCAPSLRQRSLPRGGPLQAAILGAWPHCPVKTHACRERSLPRAVHPERYGLQKLTVLGQHDERTLAQMHNCLKDERAAAGVLCADGHLGYAQPVGGVIAYRGSISVSGVGFDIACGNYAVKTN